MRRLQVVGLVVALGAATSVAAAAYAAVSNPLGMDIAAAASSAEKTAEKPAAIHSIVRDAVKQLIVVQGPKPDEVIVAIDSVFTACRPADGSKPLAGWSCPSTEQAYAALLEVRGVVLALLESPEPSEIGNLGPSPLSDFPESSASGSNYTDLVP